MNIYSSRTSESIIHRSKMDALQEKTLNAAMEFTALENLDAESLRIPAARIASQRLTRLIVTDAKGNVLYDSTPEAAVINIVDPNGYILYGLNGNKVFDSEYYNGCIYSQGVRPMFSNHSLIGTVYMLEQDLAQGRIVRSLQHNVLTFSIILELIVIAFSVLFSRIYSKKIRSFLTAIRIIQSGNYAHKVHIKGTDELAALGKEFDELTDKLEISEKKRSQFVSDASHELKTPLASIKLLTDSILQNPMDTETAMEFVEDIGKEADRLNRMTEKLLVITKADIPFEEEYEIIHMAPTVHRVVRMLSGIAKENDITISVDDQSDSPVLIQEDDLYQIVYNLVENGIKYNVTGGTLDIQLQREDEYAVIQITDSGVGISSEALPHIFERFYRVDKARSRKSGGSGLGLSIVRNMVERNSGKIQVASKPGEGSCFRAIFPVFDMD